jgi:hypothetical protein
MIQCARRLLKLFLVICLVGAPSAAALAGGDPCGSIAACGSEEECKLVAWPTTNVNADPIAAAVDHPGQPADDPLLVYCFVLTLIASLCVAGALPFFLERTFFLDEHCRRRWLRHPIQLSLVSGTISLALEPFPERWLSLLPGFLFGLVTLPRWIQPRNRDELCASRIPRARVIRR